MRGAPRGLAALLVLALLALSFGAVEAGRAAVPGVPAAPAPAPASAEAALGFGMNGFFGPALRDATGARLTHGQVWATKSFDGAHGETKLRTGVARVAAAGLVPIVEWWYFGDEISAEAIDRGLPDGRTVARWHELGPKVARAACDAAGGAPVLVVETEFNKVRLGRHEGFDGELAKHIRAMKRACPGATVALGFGLWNPSAWATFDRAAAEADALGLQILRSLAKESRASYLAAPALAVEGARHLRDLYGKPILLHDVALSSWGKGGERLQAETLRALAERKADLAEAGVVLVVYRSVFDTPSMAKGNYHVHAEAHWGLRTKAGRDKPALAEWVRATK